MLFQVLCGFEPIFYTTHPNEESYCGKIFKAMYEPFLISKASAKVACEGKLHNHIINSHYGNL